MRRTLRVQRRPADPGRPRTAPYNVAAPLTGIVSPYAPSLDFVHPDVIHVPGGWNGHDYWMGVTPYPTEVGENPSIYASDDRLNWTPPTGLTNPVVPNSGGYNSDPDIVLHDGTLHLFYRRVVDTEQIMHRASTDGVTWSAPVLLWETPTSPFASISPGFVFDGVKWWVYTANDGASNVTYRTAPSALGPWSAPQPAAYQRPTYAQTGIHTPWHLDAFRHNGKTYLLINENGEGGRNLRLAVSSDGVTFTPAPEPFMRQPAGTWDGTSLYRSTAVVRPGGDLLWVWYSAIGPGGWRLGYTEVPTADPTYFPQETP